MKSLRTKLFFWYLGSLLILTAFFYGAVHIFAIPNANDYFLILLLILALAGIFVIYWINNLLKKLSESLKREQQFITDITHELKTPMATMRASLELALQKEKNPAMIEAVREIDRLSETLKDVLELAWSESTVNSRSLKFNLSDLMEELSEITAKLAGEKKIKVDSIIDKKIEITGFREKLARAILNILENSVKYTPFKGEIDLSLEKIGKDKALIVVKDTGIGIAKKEIPFIFNRFYRGAKTEKILGNGLGLAISKSIITLHGGEIKIKSAVGKGSTFAVILPIISS